MELLLEVEAWYGLPAIRRKLAQELKKQGLAQTQIAKKLHLAPSAVSQYLSGKRGASKLPKNLDKEFTKAANNIQQGNKQTLIQEQIRLSNLLRTTRAICEIHKQHADDIPKNCTHCFETY